MSQAFTPAESTSEIVFNVSFTWSVANSSTALTVAVFRDTTCVGITVASAAGNNTVETFNYSFIDTGYAADTPVTYTVRVGRAT
ncbi:MAG: hypothetical protein GWN01_10010, partial [Nitrosopumilaceae archaeon]|nr:hypothetical protein [Nitrosopumilaceae archaeon]NIU87595.1 hypothetical protein [Nitrosopumilaceae archaeon]NIX61841.1 hypothetical protein [Nitrosopumilaceae archaeon]